MNLQVANFQRCEHAQRKDKERQEEEEVTEEPEILDTGNGKEILFEDNF